ncbi:MAG: hypothetical protein PGN33_22335 [Methylobacterium radiotolerans]
MAKLATGGWEIVSFRAVVARHDGGGRFGDLQRRPQGLRPGPRRILRDPRPERYRPTFARDGAADWQTELDYAFALVDRQSTGNLVAFLAEPILSSGGILELPPGYLAALKRKCTERGNAADPRRGPDGHRPHRPDVRLRARRGGARHPDPV